MTRIGRQATSDDHAASLELIKKAFETEKPLETAQFMANLRAEGCVVGEWVVLDGRELLAHVAFSRVFIETDRERVPACILTPLSVRPDQQRQGIGTMLMTQALRELEQAGEQVFVVLGHPDYYPRVGFRADLAAGLISPWGHRPAFMARGTTIPPGRLLLPRSIAEAS